MTSYNGSDFQERMARAAAAKQKALDQLRAKPPVDEAELAERNAARLAREAAQAEERAAKVRAKEQAEADKAAAELEAKKAKEVKLPTAAELKAARDERYAARKKRK